MMFALAERNNIPLPYADVEALRAAYRFARLQDFLDLYYQGMSVLLTEADFYDLTMAYLRRVAQDTVRHTEIFFEPPGQTGRGLAIATVIKRPSKRRRTGHTAPGTHPKIIPYFLP